MFVILLAVALSRVPTHRRKHIRKNARCEEGHTGDDGCYIPPEIKEPGTPSKLLIGPGQTKFVDFSRNYRLISRYIMKKSSQKFGQ